MYFVFNCIWKTLGKHGLWILHVPVYAEGKPYTAILTFAKSPGMFWSGRRLQACLALIIKSLHFWKSVRFLSSRSANCCYNEQKWGKQNAILLLLLLRAYTVTDFKQEPEKRLSMQGLQNLWSAPKKKSLSSITWLSNRSQQISFFH